MDTLKEITFYIGLLSTGVVAIATALQAVRLWRKRVEDRYSWSDVERGARKLLRQMAEENYVPDCIVCMGRGGAVLGALISNKFYNDRNVPLYMVDRNFLQKGGVRTVRIHSDTINFLRSPGNVLLTAGIASSGDSMKKYIKWLRGVGVREIRTAVLVTGNNAKVQPDFGFQRVNIDPSHLKMPWYKEGIIDWKPASSKAETL